MRLTIPYRDYTKPGMVDEMRVATLSAAMAKLQKYEDAVEQGRLVMLPCKVGDKVRDKIADHIFTIETVELGHKAGTLFRCGNPGTEDYMAFYDFEIGEKIEILLREEAEAALKGGANDVYEYEELVRLLKDKAARFDYDGWVDTAVVMEKAADAIKELSKPRWIPVTERLPEEFQPVWVACKMEGRENWTFDTIYDPYLKCPWGQYYYLEKGEAVVYAWMDRSDPEPPMEDARA